MAAQAAIAVANAVANRRVPDDDLAPTQRAPDDLQQHAMVVQAARQQQPEELKKLPEDVLKELGKVQEKFSNVVKNSI